MKQKKNEKIEENLTSVNQPAPLLGFCFLLFFFSVCCRQKRENRSPLPRNGDSRQGERKEETTTESVGH